MKSSRLFVLLTPMSSFVARQLARPSGWFGRFVMPRVFNRGNRALIEATLAELPLAVDTRLLDIVVDDHAKAPSGDRADRDRRMRDRPRISTI